MADYEELIRQVEASTKQAAALHAKVLANLDKSLGTLVQVQLEGLYSLRRLLIELPQFEQDRHADGMPPRSDLLKQVSSQITLLEADATKLR